MKEIVRLKDFVNNAREQMDKIFGGSVNAYTITLQKLVRLLDDKERWYLIEGNGGLLKPLTYSELSSYTLTTLDCYRSYITEFGYENFPPHIQKIHNDIQEYYKTKRL